MQLSIVWRYSEIIHSMHLFGCIENHTHHVLECLERSRNG